MPERKVFKKHQKRYFIYFEKPFLNGRLQKRYKLLALLSYFKLKPVFQAIFNIRNLCFGNPIRNVGTYANDGQVLTNSCLVHQTCTYL